MGWLVGSRSAKYEGEPSLRLCNSVCAPIYCFSNNSSFNTGSNSSNAVLASANSVSPPVPGGGSSTALSKLQLARRGLKDESTWKRVLPLL